MELGSRVTPSLLLVAVLALTPAGAQSAGGSPPAVPDRPLTVEAGAQVLGVELQLPPGADAKGLSELVSVRRQNPLSPREVRRTLERLWGTGRFSDLRGARGPRARWRARDLRPHPCAGDRRRRGGGQRRHRGPRAARGGTVRRGGAGERARAAPRGGCTRPAALLPARLRGGEGPGQRREGGHRGGAAAGGGGGRAHPRGEGERGRRERDAPGRAAVRAGTGARGDPGSRASRRGAGAVGERAAGGRLPDGTGGFPAGGAAGRGGLPGGGGAGRTALGAALRGEPAPAELRAQGGGGRAGRRPRGSRGRGERRGEARGVLPLPRLPGGEGLRAAAPGAGRRAGPAGVRHP